MPPTFVDRELERRFRQAGFVVIDAIDQPTVESLLRTCERYHPARTTTWDSDFFSSSREVKLGVAAAISGALAPTVRDLLVDHAPRITNFVVNWPGPDGGLPLHQHSSLVDERHHRSVVIWCALNDAVEANGTLHVVERSHLVPRGPWGEGRPDWFAERREDLLAEHLTAVPVEAGQAIVFDNALLHCSFPNETAEPRRTAVAVVTPHEVPLRYYRWEDQTTTAYHLDPTFFADHVSSGLAWADPDGLERVGEESDHDTLPSDQEIDALLGPGSCRHRPSELAGTSHP